VGEIMSHGITRFHHTRALIDRILETPDLVSQVRALEPATLGKLIKHVGLEDAGELVQLATTEQLERVFDEDLWRSERPGEDDHFDADRFALWLEVLVEQSAALAAKRVAELDHDLVTLALSKHLLVIDIEQLAQQMSSGDRSDDDELLDKQLESGLYQEFEEYRVISRDPRSWEAILTVLVELNEHDFATLQRLLSRCCDLSTEHIEDNGGLYEVLSSEQQVEADVAGEREDRREQLGYVAPSSALSFLRLALQRSAEEHLSDKTPDPITRSHLRAAPLTSTGIRKAPPKADKQHPTPLLEVLQLADGWTHEPAPKALAHDSDQTGDVLGLALRVLEDSNESLYGERMLELLYLANIMLAGAGTAKRRLRPAEAAEAALDVTRLGAEQLMAASKKGNTDDVHALAAHLTNTTLVMLFRAGFRLLCEPTPPKSVGERKRLSALRDLLQRQGLTLRVSGERA